MHLGLEAGSPEVFINHSYQPELSWVHQSEGIRQTREGYHHREFYLDTRRLTQRSILPWCSTRQQIDLRNPTAQCLSPMIMC